MRFLKVKDIIVEKDDRESNLIRNSVGDIIGYKQSKCTVKFIFKDIKGSEEEYCQSVQYHVHPYIRDYKVHVKVLLSFFHHQTYI